MCFFSLPKLIVISRKTIEIKHNYSHRLLDEVFSFCSFIHSFIFLIKNAVTEFQLCKTNLRCRPKKDKLSSCPPKAHIQAEHMDKTIYYIKNYQSTI